MNTHNNARYAGNPQLFEARLPDLLIDLHDQYGFCKPRPSGAYICFTVVHDNVTYVKAVAEMQALLALHGVSPARLTVRPGAEVKGKCNREVQISVTARLLL